MGVAGELTAVRNRTWPTAQRAELASNSNEMRFLVQHCKSLIRRGRTGGSFRARPLVIYHFALTIALALLGSRGFARAADEVPQPQTDQSGNMGQDAANPVIYGSDLVKATSADQPNWLAPLNTVTPLLKEFVMYGQALQTLPNGANVDLINGGMPAVGIHLIPTYYN
jgi:hypothetical protein